MAKILEASDIDGTRLDDQQIAEIWGKVAKFAEYGFNKSHAAAYAVLAYQTAYLKCHHPYAFFAASMNLDIDTTEKVAAFVREMKREDLALDHPDVNRSQAMFSIAYDAEGTPRAVRYALAAVRGLGVTAMRALVAERDRAGSFDGLADLVERTHADLNRKAYESLIDCGACDRFGHTRAAMRAALPDLLKGAQSETKRQASAQVSLFDAGLDAPVRRTVPHVAEDTRLELLQREYAALDLYLTGHPLDGVRDLLAKAGATTISSVLQPGYDRRDARIGALITDMNVRQTRDQRLMAVLTISDPSGLYEAVAFPEDYNRMRQSLAEGRAFIFQLGVGERDGMRQLFLRDIEPLNMELAKTA